MERDLLQRVVGSGNRTTRALKIGVAISVGLLLQLVGVATPTAVAIASPQTAANDGRGIVSDPAQPAPEIRPFADLAVLVRSRAVTFSAVDERQPAPDNDPGYLSIGLGVFFPRGWNDWLGPDSTIADWAGIFGIRVGVTAGGYLSSGGDSLSPSEDEDAFRSLEAELELLGPPTQAGRGFDVIITTWDYFQETTSDTEARGTPIPAGTRTRQSVLRLGVGFALTPDSDLRWGADDAATAWGVTIRYEFQQFGFESLDPAVDLQSAQHVPFTGLYLDWGIAPWLRFELVGEVGVPLRGSNRGVGRLQFSIEATQLPPFHLQDSIQLFAKLSDFLNGTEEYRAIQQAL